tara:strand:- start:524 stop:727 length:204 start_codon:yes stop_codon:yes gene_type:complete
MDTVKHIRDDIYERDHLKAFKNALAAQKVNTWNWMYMYTWKKSDGKLYDVFKNQLTRENINVLMEGQ